MKPHLSTWNRLARRAQAAPREGDEIPLGFATRVAARWRASALDNPMEVLQGLTCRGLGVAMVILAACTAYGYETLSGMLGGETALAGSWLENLLSR